MDTHDLSVQQMLACWAKLGHGSPGFHPLPCHMLDVAAVAVGLWDAALSPGMRRAFSRALGIDESATRIWLAFIAGLHDLGKASPTFQLQDTRTQAACRGRLEQVGLKCPRQPSQIGHGVVTDVALRDVFPGLFPSMEKATVDSFAQVLGGHHGLFQRSDDRAKASRHPEAVGDASWRQLRRKTGEILAEVLALPRDVAPLPLDNATSMKLAGFVSVADWIGSDEDYFPYVEWDSSWSLASYWNKTLQQAATALSRLGWLAQPGVPNLASFSDLFPRIEKRNALQQAVIDLSDKLQSPSVVIIEAPMGEGKTEAALYLVHRLGQRLGQPGFYVAMPTQATSDQMFDRVLQFLSQGFPNVYVQVSLLHGHASLSPELAEMQKRGRERLVNASYTGDHAQAAGNKGHADLGLLAAEWFSYRKRGLLAPFGVGTVDQALLAVLQTRHVFVRLWGLSNKTVIIDEAHAYDTYMTTLLERLLEWLGALGSSVIILSATLPNSRRTALCAAYTKGLRASQPDALELSHAPSADYPRLTWAAAGSAGAKTIATSERSRKDLLLHWMDGSIPPTENMPFPLGVELRAALAEGGCAAIICNTVRRAQEVYQALKSYFPGAADDGQPELDLFHAQYLYGDRLKRQERALIRFGKEGGTVKRQDGQKVEVRRPNRAVLVATQVVEQSLDLDFDLMVTDMAPVDLLLQRSGRLHRHQRSRPVGLDRPVLWVCRPEQRDGAPVFEDGTKAVYDEHVLLRSWLTLRETAKSQGDLVRVPKDVERLIEAVYRESAVPGDIADPLRRVWEETLKNQKNQVEKERYEAEIRWLKHPSYDGQLWRFLSDPREEDAPDFHIAHQALTRLAEARASLIVLYGTVDQPHLAHPDGERVDLHAPPGPGLVNELLLRSVSVGDRRVVFELLKQPVPSGWQQSSLLRNHRALVLDALGAARIGKYHIQIDAEMGFLVCESHSGGA